MDERWSSDYLRRQEMLATLETPILSEAKFIAGLPLSLIIFEECHQDLKVDFGLVPYLEGPSGQLWISPSDLLIGKVALTPPLTQKHMQALTHEGILALGTEVEQKFLNEMRIEREKAVQENSEHLRRLFASEMEENLQTLRKEEELKHSKEINELRVFFDNKICQLLWECYEQVRGLEEQMQIEFDSLNVLWQRQLELEVQETVQKITEEFLEKMRLQEQVLVNIFTKEFANTKLKKKCALELERTKCKEMLTQMRHQLHCQNIANLMYLLCKERRKCTHEKDEMRQDYTTQLNTKSRTINSKSKRIRQLEKLKNKKTKQLNVRERCLTEILRQFQKFIYFALKASPTQGEFLLNMDKLIKFELHDFCLSKYEEKPTAQGQSFMPEPMEDQAKETSGAEIEETVKTSKSGSVEECQHSDALPAFYFNDKMYVREDFRDMFSVGIEIDKKHSLWNPDVEELLDIFRKSIQNKTDGCHIANVKSYTSSVHFNQEKHSSGEPKKSPTSSVLLREKYFSKESSLSTQIRTILPEPTSSPLPPESASASATPPRSPDCTQSPIPPEFARSSIAPEFTPSPIPLEYSPSPTPPHSDIHHRKSPETPSVLSQIEESAVLAINRISTEEMRKVNEAPKKARKLSLVVKGEKIESLGHAAHVETSKKELRQNVEDSDHLELGRQGDPRESQSRTQSRLTLARDSIILHLSSIERKSLQAISLKPTSDTLSQASSEGKGIKSLKSPATEVETPDDSVNRMTSERFEVDSQSSLEGPDASSRHTSKLLLATDSIELIKSTIGLAVDKEKSKAEDDDEKARDLGQLQKKQKQVKQTSTPHKRTPRITTRLPAVAKVAGSRKTREHEKPVEEFTEERIKSLINLMKENPSLIRLFTPCHK